MPTDHAEKKNSIIKKQETVQSDESESDNFKPVFKFIAQSVIFSFLLPENLMWRDRAYKHGL